jgi:uncharacterized YccA/Bax inhibitor family protein
MRTSNPAFRENTFKGAEAVAPAEAMTVGGAAAKTGILTALLAGAAGYVWWSLANGASAPLGGLIMIGMIGGLVVAIMTIFAPRISPWTGPLYAVLEGVALGAISWIMEARYPGLPMLAVGLTLATLVGMLALYTTRIIRVNERVRAVLTTAVMGVMLFYVIALVLRLFGIPMPLIHDAGPFGIAFSVIVTGIAAFSLLLDFDAIERGAAMRAPAYFEWYTAFGLIIGLVWLYLELLRLLSKLRR